jgi:hypothetical protein
MSTIFLVMLMGLTLIVGPDSREFKRVTNPGACTITIINESDLQIERMHMAWRGTERWGTDLLGKNVLKPHTSIPIRDVAPGDYDFVFIDSRQYECFLRNLPIYSDRSWSLTNEWAAHNCRQRR